MCDANLSCGVTYGTVLSYRVKGTPRRVCTHPRFTRYFREKRTSGVTRVCRVVGRAAACRVCAARGGSLLVLRAGRTKSTPIYSHPPVSRVGLAQIYLNPAIWVWPPTPQPAHSH